MSKNAILEQTEDRRFTTNVQNRAATENEVKIFLLEKFGPKYKESLLRIAFLWSEGRKISYHRANWWKNNIIVFSKFIKAQQSKDGIIVTML